MNTIFWWLWLFSPSFKLLVKNVLFSARAPLIVALYSNSSKEVLSCLVNVQHRVLSPFTSSVRNCFFKTQNAVSCSLIIRTSAYQSDWCNFSLCFLWDVNYQQFSTNCSAEVLHIGKLKCPASHNRVSRWWCFSQGVRLWAMIRNLFLQIRYNFITVYTPRAMSIFKIQTKKSTDVVTSSLMNKKCPLSVLSDSNMHKKQFWYLTLTQGTTIKPINKHPTPATTSLFCC